jgi:hypothetical protein
MSKVRLMVFVVSLLASWSAAGRAFAQAGPEGAPAPLGPGLTPEQMQAFADLTGDNPYSISRRLAAEPQLVPLAQAAADARMSRKTTGKVLTIIGFSILGVGDIAGTAIILTTPGYPDTKGHEGRVLLGAGIGLASLAVGLAMGIPGIVKMVAASDVEARALKSYSPTQTSLAARRPAWPDSSLREPSAARSYVAPVLTLAF